MADIVERLRESFSFFTQPPPPQNPPPAFPLDKTLAEAADEIERLRAGLTAAIRAAKLALFVINKAGVMPNSSWEGGFKDDLAAAENAVTPCQHSEAKS